MAQLIFITGASSGLGQALAWRYYQSGANLALVSRRAEDIERWAEQKRMDPARWRCYGADVSQTESIVEAAKTCLGTQGVPDVVIACAGLSTGMDTAYREDLDAMASIFATNNLGTAATFHPFVAPMRARGSGTLVGVASVHGIRGMPGHGAYCASKAGIISYCEALRGEMRASGVKVVTICPGYIRTPLTAKNTYSMPFILEAPEFAQRAQACIEAGKSYTVIPWQMGVLAKILRLMPNWVFDRAFAARPRKPRSTEAA